MQDENDLPEATPDDPWSAKLPFALDDSGLLYSVDEVSDRKRLCIPCKMIKKVMEVAHDDFGHGGIQKLIDRLDGFCIPKISKHAKKFVQICNTC